MRPRRFLPRDAFDLPSDSRDAFGRGEDRLLAATRSRFRLREQVGEGRPNRPDDVVAVEHLLDRAGQPPFGTDREPTGLFSLPLRDSIRRFQRGNDLRDDGIVNPDGETFDALTRETGLDEDEAASVGAGSTDPDGTTRLGLRCREIAGDLENRAARVASIEQQIRQRRQRFEASLERVEEAAAAKAREPTVIAAAVAGIASSLATGNLLLAAAEAIALSARLARTETDLNVESRALDQAANALRSSLDDRDEIGAEIAELRAEQGRLDCSSLRF